MSIALQQMLLQKVGISREAAERLLSLSEDEENARLKSMHADTLSRGREKMKRMACCLSPVMAQPFVFLKAVLTLIVERTVTSTSCVQLVPQ